ncbi:sulfur oxidation c-type cytochrome SoxX [Jannaschia sp. EhC01]|uniref:Sulfur oxidation c-type cytochrome SoxX n=1 Tax=Gymnodinialimonas phycosphaerae TaxID=2841589 RepID=A0A975TYL3_9RHOB|nr:sulfur oxidation c-type cytochrome SoxX [Gymnodinialimonas phycosphaerae]MBY4892901.1 sulfur oxidation c-type cytochrome SoxX [Gymnodinialimonas phycosphaerae]OAN69797.1 sulfur oxidation c-type cytochrome SoxX [Jannaschia sp. EhC01]
MKRHIILVAGLALAATTSHADVTSPDDVVSNEYGDVAESLTGVPGNPTRGIEVMTDRGLGNCIACHQVTALDAYDFHGEVGPSLDGAGDRWEEAALRGIMVNAKAVFPDSVMPSFYRVSGFTRPGDGYTGNAAEGPLSPILSAQDIEDVVAYLLTLRD